MHRGLHHTWPLTSAWTYFLDSYSIIFLLNNVNCVFSVDAIGSCTLIHLDFNNIKFLKILGICMKRITKKNLCRLSTIFNLLGSSKKYIITAHLYASLNCSNIILSSSKKKKKECLIYKFCLKEKNLLHPSP